MAKSDIKKRLEGIPQETLDAAQIKLDELAKAYDLKGMKLLTGTGKWRELCFRMCGIPHNKTHSKKGGRVEKFNDDEASEILQHIFVQTSFNSKTRVEAAREIAGKYNFSPEAYQKSQNTNIITTLKNLLYVRYKKLLKKQGEGDFSIDPTDEYLKENYPDEYAHHTRKKSHK